MNEGDVLAGLMATAEGAAAPDLVVKGGQVVNVFTMRIEPSDIWVKDGRIAAVVEPGRSPAGRGHRVLDAGGTFVSPGLIDAHYHIGGSHLNVPDLARELLLRGTTGLATDFYEIYAMAGPDAVQYAIKSAEHAGLHVLFLPPGHLIGLEGLGTFGWEVKASDILAMLQWPQAVGVMEPPATAVLGRQPEVLQIVERTVSSGKRFAGHAPGEAEGRLQAYLATGASSEHESTTVGEAEAKLRLGMRPMMRHGSAAPDLPQLIELARRYPESTRYLMLCSDEVDPSDLVRHGHLDEKLRIAVAAGVPPVAAIQMASINVAEYFKADERLGSLAPGKSADMVLFQDLKEFRPVSILVRGREVRSEPEQERIGSYPGLRSQVNVPKKFEAHDFAFPAPATAGGKVDVRVIAVSDGTLVSRAETDTLKVAGEQVLSDPARDLLKIAVVERHHGTGRIGKGFVRGFGFSSGGVAMTYCHVYHNLLVVGTSDEAMAEAANAVRSLGGGIAVVEGEQLIAQWALPIAGLFDDRGLAAAQRSFDDINQSLRRIGCQLQSPVLGLSFVALPTIPAYGLTDKGLIDVASQRFVEVVL